MKNDDLVLFPLLSKDYTLIVSKLFYLLDKSSFFHPLGAVIVVHLLCWKVFAVCLYSVIPS
ncbi:MAG: hypothetical protein ACOCZS_02025, partial [Verrucomicrobiota bacterium]